MNKFKKKKDPVCIKERSNIIQFDEMGYPLLLCIMTDGSQRWIDVGVEWAYSGIEKGKLKKLEWEKEKTERHEDLQKKVNIALIACRNGGRCSDCPYAAGERFCRAALSDDIEKLKKEGKWNR